MHVYRDQGAIGALLDEYEKAIKENHEYLADSAVLRKGVNRRQYQSLILQHFDRFLYSLKHFVDYFEQILSHPHCSSCSRELILLMT